MLKKFKRLPLEKQLFFRFISASSLVLFLSVGIMLYRDITLRLNQIDRTIRNGAAYIAQLDAVEEMLQQGYPDPRVTQQLDGLSESIENLDVIVIYNTDGLRFYHTSRQQGGESFVAGEEEPILSGSEPYITTGYGTYGSQRRAFHAVKDSQGSIIGFVMISIFVSDIWAQSFQILGYGLGVLGLTLLLGVFLSRGMVALLRDSLKGHHPAELLRLYLQQADVLNALEDGVIATDLEGKILFSNQAASRLLGISGRQLEGRGLGEVFPQSACLQVAHTGQANHNRSCVMGERQVLASELPIQGETGLDGVLNIFHDKTEMLKLSDQLSGARNMLDTLRFFNHEFMNRLHVILGYLQTGETEKAAALIVNSGLVSSQAIRETADCIRPSQLCALVIGKMMHASEQGISLTVTPDSCCRPEDLLLSEQEYITVVGNLLENAVEELARAEGEVREIRLGLYCRADCNIIVCEDTGRGVDPSIRDRIFEKGVSTKGEGRGFGLPLVYGIVRKHGGSIEIVTEAGAGSCFTLTFTKQEE